jgi:hypothetical protein
MPRASRSTVPALLAHQHITYASNSQVPCFDFSLALQPARIITLLFNIAMPTRHIFIDTPAPSDVQRQDVVSGIREAEIQFADHIAQSFGGRDIDWLIM